MRYFTLAALVALSTLNACSPFPKSETVGEKQPETTSRDLIPNVKIIYSANINGEIEPCGCRSNPTGGIHRRWNLTQQKFQGEKLVIDSGDLFYQSNPVPPFLEKQWNYQASVLLKAYNMLGIEVMAPGELDFAAGLAQFDKLHAQAKFKVISSNLFYKDSEKPYLQSYVILKKGKKKVALFGLYDEALPLPEKLTAKPHIETARTMVRELRGKADVLIALTHLGIDKDIELAKQVQGIDAIFGAHTQSYLHEPEHVGETLIFQPSFRGQHIGNYENGANGMHQVDARYDSAPGQVTEMDKLVAESKTQIGQLSKDSEKELVSGMLFDSKATPPSFQTFASCTQCHAPQHDFHKKTRHFQAFQTLVKAKQAGNLDCLKCHTAGMQQPGGWKNANALVLNSAGKAIDAESFAKSLPKMTQTQFTKVSKAFINVQCESCHGAAGEHPFGAGQMKKVSSSTCLTCHTSDRAPSWYINGKPNTALIEAKLKSMTCPK